MDASADIGGFRNLNRLFDAMIDDIDTDPEFTSARVTLRIGLVDSLIRDGRIDHAKNKIADIKALIEANGASMLRRRWLSVLELAINAMCGTRLERTEASEKMSMVALEFREAGRIFDAADVINLRDEVVIGFRLNK